MKCQSQMNANDDKVQLRYVVDDDDDSNEFSCEEGSSVLSESTRHIMTNC